MTHPLGFEILGGITRQTVKVCAESLQLRIEERPFTLAEAKSAREAFITSAMNLVTPVIAIDGAMVGDGNPGPTALRLRQAYLDHAAAAS